MIVSTSTSRFFFFFAKILIGTCRRHRNRYYRKTTCCRVSSIKPSVQTLVRPLAKKEKKTRVRQKRPLHRRGKKLGT